MALQGYELDVIKQQLGYPLTRIGAEPYIVFVALFDKVIQPYLFDNTTTSTTAITTTGSTAQTITVASNPAAPNNASQLTFQLGTSCVIDVGPNQEIAVLQAISGLSFTFTFANTHPAGFTIWPNGAEWTVRGILNRIAALETQMLNVAPKTAGLSQVDEVKIHASGKGYGRSGTRDVFESLVMQRDTARDDLAAAVGVPNLWRIRAQNAGSTRVEVY